MFYKLLNDQNDISSILHFIDKLESVFPCKIPDEFTHFHKTKDIKFDPVYTFLNTRIKFVTSDSLTDEYEYSPVKSIEKDLNSIIYAPVMINGKYENVGIGEFISLDTNLSWLEKQDEFSDLMRSEQVLIISHYYSTLYWCIGLEGEKRGKIYFLEAFGPILYFGFNNFNDFLEAIVIGIDLA